MGYSSLFLSDHPPRTALTVHPTNSPSTGPTGPTRGRSVHPRPAENTGGEGLGVSRLIVGTKALKEPTWFSSMVDKFPHKLALGIDARDGMVATDGWLETSETTAISLAQQFENQPVAAIIYTDISRDGMMQGANVSGMEEMKQATSIPVIASGGVTTLNDVKQLREAGLDGAIIGRSLYDGVIDLAEAISLAAE